MSVRWGSKQTSSPRVGGVVGFALAILTTIVVARGVTATDYRGSSFIVRDPVIGDIGAYASGSTFRGWGTLGPPAIGQSSQTFTGRSGFQYFPVVNTPAVAVVSGINQVALSWNAAVGSLGWNVSGYQVGVATTSPSGPFEYYSVGNVLSSVRNGLVNDVSHYFVIRVLDAFSDSIATSTVVVGTPHAGGGVTPPAGGPPPPVPPGPPQPELFPFSARGFAPPGSSVVLLRDGRVIAEGTAAGDGAFALSPDPLPAGEYSFALYAVDPEGNRTPFVNIRVRVGPGEAAEFDGIVFAPTIGSNLIAVRRGDAFPIHGYAPPESEIGIKLRDETTGLETGFITHADSRGRYDFGVPTDALEIGAYALRARARTVGGLTSGESALLRFTVGQVTVRKPPAEEEIPPGLSPEEAETLRDRAARHCIRADINCDTRVDLIDFSILIYWWGKSDPPIVVDLSADRRVDLIDFSILVYEWTG